MTKLQEIIEYAIERGWKPFEGEYLFRAIHEPDGGTKGGEYYFRARTGSMALPSYESEAFDGRYHFDHDFLKATFGEGVRTGWYIQEELKQAELKSFRQWQYHAQKLVISEDPIQYLYDYVKEQKDE